jgi:hypothetical protein
MLNPTTYPVQATICQQLGRAFFLLLGVTEMVVGENMIKFRIKGSRKVSHIAVRYDAGSDLYVLTAYKYRAKAGAMDVVAEQDGVYADSMIATVESMTGLYARF